VRLCEVNLLGVYVAPISVIMAVAWLLLLIVRRVAVRVGLAQYVWHPALFSLAIYVIFVSSIVLFIAR
jgi:protein AaeX